MAYSVKSKGISYTAKYWFARGYCDCINNTDNPPSIEMQEYFLEMLKVSVIDEYNHGKKIAERDKVNRGG
jgi:hypothetical protein